MILWTKVHLPYLGLHFSWFKFHGKNLFLLSASSLSPLFPFYLDFFSVVNKIIDLISQEDFMFVNRDRDFGRRKIVFKSSYIQRLSGFIWKPTYDLDKKEIPTR